MSFLSTPHDEFMYDTHTSLVDRQYDDRENHKSLNKLNMVLKFVSLKYFHLLHTICLGVNIKMIPLN